MSMCFSVLLAFWSPCLGKKELIFVLIMHVFEILHDNMGLITWCDIMSIPSSAISPFDWLRNDVLNGINVPLAEWRHRSTSQSWRDVTKFEQNVHKFNVFNAHFDGFKAGNYCMINRIPCKCLLIWSLSGLTRKRGMARQSLAILTRFLVAPDKLHIKRHQHGILYLSCIFC